MILLLLLQMLVTVVTSIFDFIIPNVPNSILRVIEEIFTYIENGLGIVFYMFIDKEVVTALASWFGVVFLIILGIDILWFVIHTITLRRQNKNE